MSSYVNLERHCDDCYNLFRDIEVYQLCRAECYENDLFFLCLKFLHVPEHVQHHAAKQIVAVDGGDQIGIKYSSK